MPNFNFLGGHVVYRGLPFRVAMSYPGDWSTASFTGGIGSPSGRIGTWSFSTPSYDSTTDTTQIDFYLTSAVTAGIKPQAAGYPYDIIARFSPQDPVLLLRGLIGVLGVCSDISSVGVGTSAPVTPNLSIKVQLDDSVILLGIGGFVSGLIENAVTAHVQLTDPHPNYLLEQNLTITAVPGLQTALNGKQNASNRLTQIAALNPSTNQIIRWNGSAWIASNENSGSSGVPSVNSITGAVTVEGSGGTSVSTSGSTITISSPVGLTQSQGDARYRLQSVALTDSDIPSSIARDSEVSVAISGVTPSSIGAVASNVSGIVGASAIANIVQLTQSSYDALSVKDPNTLYVTY